MELVDEMSMRKEVIETLKKRLGMKNEKMRKRHEM